MITKLRLKSFLIWNISTPESDIAMGIYWPLDFLMCIMEPIVGTCQALNSGSDRFLFGPKVTFFWIWCAGEKWFNQYLLREVWWFSWAKIGKECKIVIVITDKTAKHIPFILSFFSFYQCGEPGSKTFSWIRNYLLRIRFRLKCNSR